jgi:light-regulated signal transduction histidine kinase (bacteriophytochrome)
MIESLSVAFVVALARKRSDQEVQELNSRLEAHSAGMKAALEELDAFSYSISHDLRAPLRHIIGFSELLQRELQGQLPGKSAHYLETILASSQHLGNLIDGLLAFSQSNRGTLQKRPVDLGALVKEIIASMEPELKNRHVVWSVANLPTVEADPVLLRTVLVNLLSNAVKFTRIREEARISIGSEDQGAETAIFVADNGAGFNPKYKDKLFGVFQRLHAAAQFEGTGVGLANVRRIILRHGGRTWATGAPDDGATFTFTLPARQDKAHP